MSLTNPNKPVTEARLQEFYHRIKSYLGFTEMPSEDMSEVISPLPSVQSRYHRYSTEEQIVGEWIDGKPIYQRTFTGTTITDGLGTRVSIADIPYEYITIINGNLIRTNGAVVPIQAENNTIKFVVYIEASKNIFVIVGDEGVNKGATFYVTIQYTKTTDTSTS